MFPPYVNEFVTSAASCIQNSVDAPRTITAAKITAPHTTVTGSSSAFTGVHATSSSTRAHTSTISPCATRPNRRSANLSAATWASSGAGRIRNVSSEPSLTRLPIRWSEPIVRSAIPKDVPVSPYRRATSANENPPRPLT